ncbi:GNAT family N-acetyltransferase [Deinococcus hopiensis]|nr:GNAT family N-acetyltransferase [Deinococcus hopiensis]
MRPTTFADASTVAQHRYPETDVHAEPVRVYATWVAEAMERGTYLGWFVEESGRVAAGLGLTLLEWGPTKTDPSPTRARVVNVFTVLDYRQRGFAAALLKRAISEARARGIGTLSLGTTDQARSLYTRLGFRPYEAEMVCKLHASTGEPAPASLI